MNKKPYLDGSEPTRTVDWSAVIGVVLGAIIANLVHWGFPAINGMAVAAVCYLIGQRLQR